MGLGQSTVEDLVAAQPYRGKTVLITGARGFIGRPLVKSLADCGASVEALDGVDIRHRANLQDRLLEVKPEIVFHLAATTRGRGNEPHAIEHVFETNVTGTANVLNAARLAGASLVIFASTGDECEPSTSRYTEASLCRPRSLYATSKAAASAWTLGFHQFSEMATLVARMSIAYGPSQRPHQLIPQLLEALHSDTVLEMSPGEQVRDFIWLADVVEGLMRLGLRPDLGGQAFNLCSGEGHSLRQLVAIIEDIVERPVPVKFGALPYRPGEALYRVGDPGALEAALNWRPHTSLKEGLRLLLKPLPKN